jgi:anaerobic selenocysteine-containing dehydrogenase
VPAELAQPEGTFRVATRRGKQFNTMVLEQVDPSNQAVREAVLVSRADAERLGLANGDPVVLRSDVGEYRGRAHIAPVTPGSLQVHWPEGRVLIDRHRRSPQAGIPGFNAFCTLEKAGTAEPAPAPTG